MQRNSNKIKHVMVDKITPMAVEGFKPTKENLHSVSTVRKSNKPKVASNAWVAKYVNPRSENPVLFELEGAAGDFYRLFIGDREPKGRPISYNSLEVVGLLSKLIKDYQPFFEKSSYLNIKQIKQLAEIMVTAYFLEEHDMHVENIGYNDQKDLIKIDHGQSFWSIGKKYHYAAINNVIDFSISSVDILNLPKIKKGLSANISPITEKLASDLVIHEAFIESKFKALLKITLMTDDVCKNIFTSFVQDHKLQNKLHEHLIKRRDELLDTLIYMAEFRNYILKHENVIDEIKLEFNTFNTEFRKPKHAARRINIDQVGAKYYSILSTVKFFNLKHLILEKVKQRLNDLKTETGSLALIKYNLFELLEQLVIDAGSTRQIINEFDDWSLRIFSARKIEDADFDRKSCVEIMEERRKFDPRCTKSSICIEEINLLLKDQRPKCEDLYACF